MKNMQEFTIRIPKSDDVSATQVKAFLESSIKGAAKAGKRQSPIQGLAEKAKVVRTYTKRVGHK